MLEEDPVVDSPGDVTPTCRVCGSVVTLSVGPLKNLGRWVHEETLAEDGAEKDHDAVR